MSTEELNISAAVQRYEVSRKTVRRRLAEGAIEDARQVPGDHGPEWVFPAASLEALGYNLRPSTSGPGTDKGDDQPSNGELPFAGSDPAPSRSRWRELVVVLAVAAGLLIGIVGTTLFRSDGDPPAPLAALLEELTSPGDEIGVVGAPTDAGLPAGRIPVPLDQLDNAPRYVLIGDDGDPAALDTLLAGARPVLALERPTGDLWLFDTGSDPLPASSTAESTTTSTSAAPAGPSITSPTTTTPTVTSIVESPTTTVIDPGPVVDPEPSEGDPTDPAVDPTPEPGSPTTITVAEGDSFWTIAEGLVADSLGSAPTDAQITGYWASLVDANVDSLVQPGNADLILPGQVLQLPPI